MTKKKKRLWYQYDFEDVFGKEWRTDARLREEQISLGDLYDGSVLGVESEDERYRRDVYKKSGKILCRTIISGDQVECDIYPVWGRHDVPRGVKSRESRVTQKNINRKNSQRRLLRLIHANFTAWDLIMTLTYDDYHYPSKERAKKDIRNYLTAIRRERIKAGMDPLKYIYVIEYVSDPENTNKVRIHHHLIMNAIDRDLAESKWKKGRVNAKYADPDGDFGLEGFGRYITKIAFSKGEHAWQGSRNLKKPIIHESVTKLTRRKMYDMVRSGDGIGKMMEQMYKGRFRYLDSKIYCSDYVGGYYIYGRMRKREGVSIVDTTEQTGKTRKTSRTAGSDPVIQESRQEVSSDVCSNAEEKKQTDSSAAGGDPENRDKQSGTERTVESNMNQMHTDIYINAMWHGDPDLQVDPADGEYVVTNEVETKDGIRSGNVFGAWRGLTREQLYLRALLDALGRYTRACDITVHCDHTRLWAGINNGTYLGYTEDELSKLGDATMICSMRKMMEYHNITVKLEGKNKYTDSVIDLLKNKIKKGSLARREVK